MKKIHIIKADAMVPHGWEIREYLYKNNMNGNIAELIGQRIAIKWKDGKRKKLTRFHLLGFSTSPCDTCGSHSYMRFCVKGRERIIEIF